jgi:hypothetical protein
MILLLLFIRCALSPAEEGASPVVINEFMAKNTGTGTPRIIDEHGEANDWIELFNTADTQVSLKGLYLSDDTASLKKYALFDTVLQPHGYALVWADGKPKSGKHHCEFKLSATNGDIIFLSNEHGRVIDTVNFLANSGHPEARLPDQSYGRSADGTKGWCQQKTPTPLAKNLGCLKP